MKIKKVKARRRWRFNPKTRVVESKKIYKRAREKRAMRSAAQNV